MVVGMLTNLECAAKYTTKVVNSFGCRGIGRFSENGLLKNIPIDGELVLL